MNGIINLLKPPGMSSNGATVFLRKLLDEKRVGMPGRWIPGPQACWWCWPGALPGSRNFS